MTRTLFAAFLTVLVLAACGGPEAAPSPAAAEPTEVEAPAATEPPTATEPPVPTPVPPTATPENQIFRDDFSGSLQPGWTWENEDPSRWSITDDGWLQIVGGDGALLGATGTQSNLLFRDLPAGDFAITVHLIARPVADFQQAAIYIYQDAENYVTINHGFCSFPRCVRAGVYMDYSVGGVWGGYTQAVSGPELYLRLERLGDVLSGYSSLDGSNWQRVGRFGDYFELRRVGIGVSNVDAPPLEDADLVGQYDYFEITRPGG